MRLGLLAATAAVTIATPAYARDGSPYIGIEGGVLFPRDQDFDSDLTDFDVNGDGIPDTTAPLLTSGRRELDYKRGLDLDAIVGYDFGPFRIEGELGWKRAKARQRPDGPLTAFLIDQDFVVDLNDDGVIDADDAREQFGGRSGRVKVLSGMVNGLLDFGDEDGLSFYTGGGAGLARFKAGGQKDRKFAWQLIAGARYAITSNLDVGLKYRYFRSKLNLGGDDLVFVDDSDNPLATVSTDFRDRFQSHSLLASLIFNFGGREAAPPPPPPPPEPVVAPPPPPTQTCPDGSVILATDVCPAPPPPPPPPEPAPERG